MPRQASSRPTHPSASGCRLPAAHAHPAHALALLIILLLTVPASGQTTYRVAGTVISALTRQPVQRASLRLAPTENNGPPLTATADEFGRFAFSGVPAGSFGLSGDAPGFLPTSYQQHGTFSTAIITGAGVDTESLTLVLHPLGSLSGTVTDESAEPVRDAQVHLFHRDRESGETRILPGRTANTDDQGRYEFPRLQPNTYFVAVIAQPWYAVHPPPIPIPQQPFGITGPIDPALDVAYPVTFFPGATEQTGAEPIPVNGNSARADLQLTPMPAVSLNLQRNLENTGGQPLPQLHMSLFGTRQYIPAQVQQTPTGVFLTGVAAGDYLLQTPSSTGQPTDGAPIHLTRDTPANVPTAPSAAHVHLTVHHAPGSSLPADLHAGLVPPGTQQATVGGPLSPTGEADFAVSPGTYYLHLGDRSGRVFFARDVRVDDKPRPDSTLTLAANSRLSLSVTALPGTHTLRGIVHNGSGKPCAGAMLLLIPAESHSDLRLFFRQQSDLDGSFDIPGLAPGPYLLLAFQDGWDLDWGSPASLARTLPHSVPVLIPETGADYVLPHPIAVQQP